MSGMLFDRWTRRRVGQLAAGLGVALVALPGADLVARKKRKKRRKRRCITLGKACTDGGKRCCKGRTCGGNPVNGTFCCKQGGEACGKNRDCCNEQCFEGFCALN